MNILERLRELEGQTLAYGSHEDREKGLCVMEAVAYVANEEHSDQPRCVCPVIADFMRTWNDGLRSDEERDRLLRPLIPQLLNSRSTAEVQQKRAEMALAWLVNVHTATWLELTPSLRDHATALRCVDVTADSDKWCAPVHVAMDAAMAAAMDAARAAAMAAAGDAAGDAAENSLEPTVKRLQMSALDLVDRMLKVEA